VEAESAYRWRAKEDRMSEQADGTGGADAAGAADVVDSPTDWVNKHIKNYVATDGEQGHVIQAGAPVLLLTVVGRRTGVLRRTALIYGRDGENYVVVASAGGAPGSRGEVHRLGTRRGGGGAGSAVGEDGGDLAGL
jgi:F420H(2)-dependent quinone reductase